jgi:cystathionine beta-lyase
MMATCGMEFLKNKRFGSINMSGTLGKHTKAVHAGGVIDERVGGVTTPIHTASSYLYYDDREIGYPRYGSTPTQKAAAEKIAALEGGERGFVAGSGMGVITTTFLTFLGAGDHVVIQRGVYGGTHHMAVSMLPRLGIQVDFVEAGKAEDMAAALKPNTKLVYFETPTNPLLDVLDITGTAEIAKAHGALSVIDNTFATPINQTPLELGVDIVLHSGTKYLGGHSDLNCGAAVMGAELMERFEESFHCTGPTLNVYDAYLLERSLKTLALRVERHNVNAQALAEYLEKHPKVERVYYPGLPSHPRHDIAAKQMTGFGGMLSLDLQGDAATARRVVDALALHHHAVSLGGVESLVCFPALTSHSMMPGEERRAMGVGDSLVRVSVGIEDTEDILADWEQALEEG